MFSVAANNSVTLQPRRFSVHSSCLHAHGRVARACSVDGPSPKQHSRRQSFLAGIGFLSWIWASNRSDKAIAETWQGNIRDTDLEEDSSAAQDAPGTTLQMDSLPELQIGLLSGGALLGLVGFYAYTLRNALFQVRSQLEQTEGNLTSTRETLVELQSGHDALSRVLSTTEKTLEERSRQLTASELKREDISGKLSAALDDLKKRRLQISDLSQELKAERTLATEKQIEAETCVQELQGKLDTAVAEGKRVQGELTAAVEQMAQRTATLRQVEQNLIEAERDLGIVQRNLNEERNRVSTLEKARAAAVLDVRNALGKLRDLSFALEEEKEGAKRLEQEVNTLKAQVLKLEEDLREAEALARSKAEEISRLSSDKRNLHTSLEEALDREKQLQEDLRTVQEEVKRLMCQIKEEQEKISHLIADKAGTERMLESKTASIQELESSLQAALSREREITAELQMEKTKAKCLTEELQVKDKDIQTALQASNNLRSQLISAEAQAGRLATVEEQLGLVTQEAQAVEEKLKVAQKDSRDLKRVRAKLSESEENLKAVQKEVVITHNASRAELSQAKMELVGAQRETQNLRKKLSVMEKQMQGLRKELLSAEADVTRLECELKQALAKEDNDESANDTADEKDGSRQKPNLLENENVVALAQQEQRKKQLPSVVGITAEEGVETQQAEGQTTRPIAEIRPEAAGHMEPVEDRTCEAVDDTPHKAEAAEKTAHSFKQKSKAAQDRVQQLEDSLD